MIKGEMGGRYPVFLPDGKRFLFLVARVAAASGIYLGSLEGGSPKRLLPDESNMAWFQPTAKSRIGLLLFVRDENLMSQPFDSQTFEPAGEPLPVVAALARLPNSLIHKRMSISQNGLLLYQCAPDARSRQLTWYDRSGKVLSAKDAGLPNGLALSRDGKQIAMDRRSERGSRCDIWLQDVARGLETRVSSDSSVNRYPVWSPDGHRVAFSSGDRIVSKALQGPEKDEPLLDAPNSYPMDWSADGRFLLYVRMSTNVWDIWTLENPLGSPAERKTVPFLSTDFNHYCPAFSPDGNWVAYACDKSGKAEVYVSSFPKATVSWRVSNSGGFFPKWRADGNELFYFSPGRKLMAADVRTSPGSNPPFEAVMPHELFTSPVTSNMGQSVSPYVVSANGDRFLVITSDREVESNGPLILIQNWPALAKKQ